MLWTEQLTHRIASEELAEETASARGPLNLPRWRVRRAGSGDITRRRRSWFEGSLADVEPMASAPVSQRMNVRADPRTGDSRPALRLELERVLEQLAPRTWSSYSTSPVGWHASNVAPA